MNVLRPSLLPLFGALGVPTDALDVERDFVQGSRSQVHWDPGCSHMSGWGSLLRTRPSLVVDSEACRHCWSRAFEGTRLAGLVQCGLLLLEALDKGGRRLSTPPANRPLELSARLRRLDRAGDLLSSGHFAASGLEPLRDRHAERVRAQRDRTLAALRGTPARRELCRLVALRLVRSQLVESPSWGGDLLSSVGPVGPGRPARWFVRSLHSVWEASLDLSSAERAARLAARSSFVSLGVGPDEPERRSELYAVRAAVAPVLSARFDAAFTGLLADTELLPFGVELARSRVDVYDDLPDALLAAFSLAPGAQRCSVLLAPRPVLHFLASFRRPGSSLPLSLTPLPDVPPDPALLEVAAALWDPASKGPFCDLAAAVTAAAASRS